jgi:hypothetical protein
VPGYAAPGTPAKLNRVGVVKVGPNDARNVLVLEPGTSAGAAYFVPLAKTLVKQVKGWQVWSVERRENQLEDHSMLDQATATRPTRTTTPARTRSSAASSASSGRSASTRTATAEPGHAASSPIVSSARGSRSTP